MDLERLTCCGLREALGISGYDTAEEMLTALCHNEGTPRLSMYAPTPSLFAESSGGFSHIVFTDAARSPRTRTSGDKLASYIRRYRLGSVSAARKARNPNSGNILGVYVWTVNRKALAKWYTTHPYKEED